MIYSGKFKVTSPFGMRTLNGVREEHRDIDVVGITDKYICAVTGVGAVELLVGGVIKIAEAREERKEKKRESGELETEADEP